jgi:hypothetical protein
MELLFPYQRNHVDIMYQLLQRLKCVSEPSDTGTGKTFTTCALGLITDRPLFISCPKQVVETWFDVADLFGIVLLGVTNYESGKNGKYYDQVETYQDDKRVECPYIKITKDPDTGEPIFDWDLPNNAIIIFDEVHKGKNSLTINSQFISSARKILDRTAVPGNPAQGVKCIILSATITDSIENFRTVAYLLGIAQETKHAYKAWIKSLKPRKIQENNMPERDETTIEILYRTVYPEYGHRMRIRDLLADPDDIVRRLFLHDDVRAETYEMSEEIEREITNAYERIDAAITDLKNKQIGEEHPLTIILRARQRIEMLKVPTFVLQAMEELWNNRSVVIFVNFTETLEQIFKDMDDFVQNDCESFIAVIKGGQTSADRKYNINAFQTDKARLLIANIKAGGVAVSLHDLNGNFPRTSFISPTWSSIELKQVLGRIRRAGAKTSTRQRIIYCKGKTSSAGNAKGSDTTFVDNSDPTKRIGVEELVAKAVNEKLRTIEWLNNGDENELLII